MFLVEDDALPRPDLFTVLRHTLDTHLEGRYRLGDYRPPPYQSLHPQGPTDDPDTPASPPSPKEVAYVKFYHPERLSGFLQPEWERIPELVGWGVTLGSVLAWAFLLVYPRALADYNTHCIWAFFVFYVMVAVALIGRVYVNEVRRTFTPHLYTFNPAPHCCTPAMLFPRRGGVRVASFLDNVECGKNYGKDSAIEDFLRGHTEFRAYQVQPNTFTHIGMYSSLRSQIVDPYMV